jgi:HEAT repeat protein
MRNILLVLGFIITCGIVVWLSVRPRTAPPVEPTKVDKAPLPLANGREEEDQTPRPSQSPLLGEISLQGRTNPVIAASRLRQAIRQDLKLLDILGRTLLDPSAPHHLREIIACVLGTIADKEAQDLLLLALREAKSSDWKRVLILAIGTLKDTSDEDDIFGIADSPWLVRTPSGLSLIIKTVLKDEKARSAILRMLCDEDPSVRDASVRSLFHSVRFRDVRQGFLAMLDSEGSKLINALAGKALAEWIATRPADSKERAKVLTRLVHRATGQEEFIFRFRIQDGLRRADLTDTEIRAFTEIARDALDFQIRIWALEILQSKITPSSRGMILGISRDMILKDPHPKVRQHAALLLGELAPEPEAIQPLLIATGDSWWNVRYQAIKALARFKLSQKISKQIRRIGLNDPDERVRKLCRKIFRE